MSNNINTFKKELHDLLNKYNVTIGVQLEGDTFGIVSEKFIVYSDEPKRERVLCHDSAWLNAKDLK